MGLIFWFMWHLLVYHLFLLVLVANHREWIIRNQWSHWDRLSSPLSPATQDGFFRVVMVLSDTKFHRAEQTSSIQHLIYAYAS